jgi:hypothetical protein
MTRALPPFLCLVVVLLAAGRASSAPRLASPTSTPQPASPAGAAQPRACTFVPVEDHVRTLARCALVDARGQAVLTREAREVVRRRGGNSPVAVSIEGLGLAYVNRAGRVAPVVLFDNGPDYFEEGLARTIREHKIGFVDRHLVEQITPRWDFAFPFHEGVAAVCQGCTAQKNGEHSVMSGGRWGYIDHQGRTVVPVKFDRDHLPTPPRAGHRRGNADAGHRRGPPTRATDAGHRRGNADAGHRRGNADA